MKKDYPLSPQQVHDAIQNTIRVFNEYKLDRKIYENNIYKIHSIGGEIYQYQLFVTPNGTQLKMQVLSRTYKMTEERAVPLVTQFISRLDQVISGQIILTPDTVNKDVYKTDQTALGMLSLTRIVLAIISAILALKLLMIM